MRQIFDSAILKLTLIYTAILFLVSLIFSISFYQVSTRELDSSFIAQTQIIRRSRLFQSLDDPSRFLTEQRQELELSKSRLSSRLILLNLIILIGSGLLSYFLAKKTLKPIADAHEAQTRFTADASHELRTPLAAIKSETEVLLRDKNLTKKEAVNQLKSNLEELDKIAKLSDRLLKLARNNPQTFEFTKVDVKKLVNNAVKQLAQPAKTKSIKVDHKIRSAKVFADEIAISEVITILLDNAIKYSPIKSTIKIHTKLDNRFVKIMISDNGPGIPKSEQNSIFQRFYRGDASRTKSKQGYGLGLALAQQIASYHGSKIKLDSQSGKGSTFYFKLKRAA